MSNNDTTLDLAPGEESMMCVATINVPGYLPTADEPATFDTIGEA